MQPAPQPGFVQATNRRCAGALETLNSVGQVSTGGRDAAVRLLAALRARFSTIAPIWADGGYTGRLVGWAQAVLGFAVTIVKRTDDLSGFRVIPRRWVVERTLAWISKHRRCVRDYETLPALRGDGPHRNDYDHVPAPDAVTRL